MDKAIILTGGMFATNYAKTAHGLVRSGERFEIVGVIDCNSGGLLAHEIVPLANPIKVYSTPEAFFAENPGLATHCIVGVATKGGKLPDDLKPQLIACMEQGLHLVNGLHQLLYDDTDIAALARSKGLQITDIRKPKSFKELRFWDGSIEKVTSYKIAVLGTDCSVGKRTTSRFLVSGLRNEGVSAEMIYTGQTGWMQGSEYGFIFDATVNDFISGELEGAILKCFYERQPRVMLIEGQSALRNPSGPCGAEFILSAAADAVILQIVPTRQKFKGLEHYPAMIPSVADELKLLSFYGAPVMAITVNTEDMTSEEAFSFAEALEKELNIPVVLPIEMGVERLVRIIAMHL